MCALLTSIVEEIELSTISVYLMLSIFSSFGTKDVVFAFNVNVKDVPFSISLRSVD